jgi:hypothetical protein
LAIPSPTPPAPISKILIDFSHPLEKSPPHLRALAATRYLIRIPDYSLAIVGTLLGLTTKKKIPMAAR